MKIQEMYDKEFKIIVLKMFKIYKRTQINNLTKSRRQIKSKFNKYIEKTQKKLELKTVTKLKNSIESSNNRLNQTDKKH